MLEDKLIRTIDDLWPEIWRTALYIYQNPELGGQEYKAVQSIKDLLVKYNFSFQCPIYGLQTAFRAQFNEGKPVICFLAEYDALPEIGHGCGHHLIAGASIGAAIALATLKERWSGSLIVLGTPSEETAGAKVQLVEKGAFDNIDIALMFHPGHSTVLNIASQALEALEVTFIGFQGHSSRGQEGNPLVALVNFFQEAQNYKSLYYPKRQIDGVITSGGVTPNLIPEKAVGKFYLRAETIELLQETINDFREMAQKVAKKNNTKVILNNFEPRYLPMQTNRKLAEVFKEKAKLFGIKMDLLPQKIIGSMDMGNVSWVVPSIHPFIQLGKGKIAAHTPEFTRLAGTMEGEQTMKLATKTLALTAAQLFDKPRLVEEIWQEHIRSRNLSGK
ncbi:MAG: M20 family metallopeptidase [Clostridia bacterium]|nr:M20 family metallopeptidase [Clostridia bacterium]